MAFDQIGYITQFSKENYDVIRATIPKGKRKVVRECATAKGVSISRLIVDALEQCYNLDLSKTDGG